MIAPIRARAITPIAKVSLNDNDTNVGWVAALASPANARIDAPTNRPIAIGPLQNTTTDTITLMKVTTKD